MNKESIWKSNNVQVAVKGIQEFVKKYGYFSIIFPDYDPEFDDEEYSVIGLEENREKIAEILAKKKIKSEKFAPGCYLFYSPDIPEEKLELVRGHFGTMVQFYMD